MSSEGGHTLDKDEGRVWGSASTKVHDKAHDGKELSSCYGVVE